MKVTLANCLIGGIGFKRYPFIPLFTGLSNRATLTYVNVDTAVGGCSLAQVKDFIKYAMIYSV